MKKVLLIASVLLGALLCSCEKKIVVEDAVTIKTDAATVPVEGGVVSIALNSTVAWTAKSSQPWVTISPASGEAGDATIKASVLKNETNDDRTAEITVTAGTKSAKFTLTQSQLDALEVKTVDFVVPAEGGTVEIPVSANVNYSVVIPDAVDWITVTKGMVDSKVVLQVAETHEYAFTEEGELDPETIVRDAQVKIVAGSMEKVVTVGQQTFLPYFDYEGDWAGMQWSFYWGGPTVIPQEGADITIDVATNLEWRVFFSIWDNEQGAMVDCWDNGWARLTYDVEASQIHLVIDANDSFVPREEYLYAECTIDGVVSGDFGGLGFFRQDGLTPEAGANVMWTKLLSEVNIPAGVNRLAFTESGALLVSDGEQVHALNPENGDYWQSISWPGIHPTSIDVDDAGNVIIAEDVVADMNWETNELVSGTEIKIYCAKDVNETPKEIVLPNGLYGTLGSFRARGDLSTKGAITGVAGGAAYWFGYDIADYAAVPNYYGTQNSGAAAGPNVFWSPLGATAVCYGDDLHDGVLYRGYDGAESVYYRHDAYTPKWVCDTYGLDYEPWTLVTNAGAGGNENQNNMDIIDYQGRKIIAYTQGVQFSYGGNTSVYVVDVTNPAAADVIAILDGSELASVEAIAPGEEAWPGAYYAAHIGADVLLREEEGLGLVLYVVNSSTESLSKLLIVF